MAYQVRRPPPEFPVPPFFNLRVNGAGWVTWLFSYISFLSHERFFLPESSASVTLPHFGPYPPQIWGGGAGGPQAQNQSVTPGKPVSYPPRHPSAVLWHSANFHLKANYGRKEPNFGVIVLTCSQISSHLKQKPVPGAGARPPVREVQAGQGGLPFAVLPLQRRLPHQDQRPGVRESGPTAASPPPIRRGFTSPVATVVPFRIVKNALGNITTRIF